MKTVSQVTKLTGISARTLQYYDEIDLLKPSELTEAGYRLYNDEALEKLQQILFFKELEFKLQDIRELMNRPNFDKVEAFKKQKELLQLKRNRIDKLIQLLSRLERGEQCMSFKEFDLSDYIEALEAFKVNRSEDIIKYWGSIKNFEIFLNKIKDDEKEVAKLAIKYFGSIEKYTQSMKYNLEHFSEIMEEKMNGEVRDIMEQSDLLYAKLTADMSKDVSSQEIQQVIKDIVLLMENTKGVSAGEEYINAIIDSYSNDYVKSIIDGKYGIGASDYIVEAFRFYFSNNYSITKSQTDMLSS